MSSLIEQLLMNHQSPSDRLMQVLPLLQAQGSTAPSPSGSAPPGRGIFGNDSVDVLDPNDPRLVSRFGVTLARPAMRSLTDVLRSVGYTGDAGGGYRSPQEQADIYAAKPGLAAPPGSSYHQEGLAIDLSAALQNARVADALRAAGWSQFSPSGEPWHWSFGVTG